MYMSVDYRSLAFSTLKYGGLEDDPVLLGPGGICS